MTKKNIVHVWGREKTLKGQNDVISHVHRVLFRVKITQKPSNNDDAK